MERAYDTASLTAAVESVGDLNRDQRKVFDHVVFAVENDESDHKMVFLDGPGGTGKSFLPGKILAVVRAQRRIALAVAPSGIAALLLPGGRTAHSRFKIPLDLTDTSSCHITQ